MKSIAVVLAILMTGCAMGQECSVGDLQIQQDGTLRQCLDMEVAWILAIEPLPVGHRRIARVESVNTKPQAIHMYNAHSHGHPILTCYSIDGLWNKATGCRIEKGYDLTEVVRSFIAIMEEPEP